MKLVLAALLAAVFAVGTLAVSTTTSHAGSRTVDITPGTKAYRSHKCKRCRHHRKAHRHRHKHRAYHRRHKRHSAHRRHARKRYAHKHYARKHYARKHHARRYSRHVHGARHRVRRPGYTFHYAGFWYASVWWVPVRVDRQHGRHLSHPEWCRQQYGRYYHERSNTYLASDGIAYRCLRPKGF